MQLKMRNLDQWCYDNMALIMAGIAMVWVIIAISI